MRVKLKNKINQEKDKKTKKIALKRKKTKLNTKIKLNKMLRDKLKTQ
jgi:hypothetical protein